MERSITIDEGVFYLTLTKMADGCVYCLYDYGDEVKERVATDAAELLRLISEFCGDTNCVIKAD